MSDPHAVEPAIARPPGSPKENLSYRNQSVVLRIINPRRDIPTSHSTDISVSSATMSFAFQGFGLGEFFKAQQKLTDILDLYFWGIFDAPSAFLLLGHTLGDLSEEIDHLFDENSNPNSAILRSDNRPNIQQILRVASHGVLDVVNELENVLRIPGDNNKQDSSPDLFLALEASGLRPTIIDLNSKFAFQTWKLKLFFRISRK